eukprot:gene17158-26330_t
MSHLAADAARRAYAGDFTIEVDHESDIMYAIHCGSSSAYTAASGITYSPDAHFTGGRVDAFVTNTVQRTVDDPLYTTARSGMSAYSFPVPNGDYIVFLQLAETYFSAANARVFDVSVEGTLVVDDLDLAAELGGKWVAETRRFEVAVADGELTLAFSASVNNPLVNAIVVVPNFDRGTVFGLPAVIPAVDYRPGGPGVGYTDLTPANQGGAAYRPGDAVDIETSTGGGHNIGYIQAGESLSYFVRVTHTVAYKWVLRAASLKTDDKTVRLLVDGQVVKTLVFNTNGAGWQNFKDYVVHDVALSLGPHEVTLAFDSSSFNVKSFSLLLDATTIRINAGGVAASAGENPFLAGDVRAFSADTSYTGGSVHATASTIDVSGVLLPAPQSVYQTERWGAAVYSVSGLTAGSGKDRAIVKEYQKTADEDGRITVELVASVQNPKINGIEILSFKGGSAAQFGGDSFTLTVNQAPAILDVLANDVSSAPVHVMSVDNYNGGSNLIEVAGNAVKFTPALNYAFESWAYGATDGLHTSSPTVFVYLWDAAADAGDLTSLGLTRKWPANAEISRLNDESLSLTGGGIGFYFAGGSIDEKVFAWADIDGDFDARLQVKMLTNVGPAPRCGLEVSDNTGATPRFFAVSVTPDGAFEVAYRHEAWTRSTVVAVAGVTSSFPHAYLRIVRVGHRVTGFYSTDNVFWRTITSTLFPLEPVGRFPNSIDVGPFVFSGQDNLKDQAVVDNLIILQ